MAEALMNAANTSEDASSSNVNHGCGPHATRPQASLSLKILAFLAVATAIYFARDVLIPLTLAVLLALLLRPFMRVGHRLRLPDFISSLILVGVVAAIFAFGVLMLAGQAQKWLAKAPEMVEKVGQMVPASLGPLSDIGRMKAAVKDLATTEDTPQPVPVEVQSDEFNYTVLVMSSHFLGSTAIAVVGRYVDDRWQGLEPLWHWLSSALTLILATLLFALIFKVKTGSRRPRERPAEPSNGAKGRSSRSMASGLPARATPRAMSPWSHRSARTWVAWCIGTAQFIAEGELIDEDGNVTQGRSELEKLFAKQFAQEDCGNIAVEVESIRFLSDNLATEVGELLITNEEQTVPLCRYTAWHVREGGKWLVACACDAPVDPAEVSRHERLEDLEWLVGDWLDEGEDSVVETQTRWDEQGNFLLREYCVQVEGNPALSGSQRIGWCPLTKQLKTWCFDDTGGESTGYWHQDGDRWILKLTGVSGDGQIGTAIHVYTPVDNHKYKWQAVHRTLGGEPLPDIEEAALKPIEAAAIEGTWRASREDGSQFDLVLSPDKTFTWKFSHDKRQEKLSGKYSTEGALLILEPEESGALIGRVTMNAKNEFNFKLVGASPEDPGLTFKQ